MKSFKKLIMSLGIVGLAFTSGFSQSTKTDSKAETEQSKTATSTFKVLGNCGMCKKTIENSLKVKGVQSAIWNKETKQIEVAYFPGQITEDKLHNLIASVGYDTEKVKAADNVYAKLHGCCQYDRSGFDKKETDPHAGHSH